MSDGPKNVVWITLESVRAANASVNGYERDTTPNLRRIGSQPTGTVFSNCFSQSMWTPASSASIHTGTYLFEHRVGYDGKAEEKLPEAVVTLPQLLREQGYRTACLTPTTYMSEATGMDRGYDKYHFLINIQQGFRDGEVRVPLLKYLSKLGTYGHGLSTDLDKYNKTYVMLEMLKRWTRSFAKESEPFFLYTHVPNGHLPYTPPRKWIDRYTDEIAFSAEEALEFSLETYASRDRMIQQIADGCNFTSDEWDALMAMYDAEINYADEFVGSLFDHVQGLDVGETVFVITADHGDLFGEHGLLGHNLVLDDALTNVPMVVHGLDGLDHAEESLVQHIDVTRTVAEALGVSHDQFSGRNLTEEAPEYAISQRGVPHFDEYLEKNPEFDTSRYHGSPLSAFRTAEFKFLKSSDKEELFRLPDEQTDVTDEHPDVHDSLDGELKTALEAMESFSDSSQEAHYTDAMEQQLADLGYL
jgi:uncharacterized sulfatase